MSLSQGYKEIKNQEARGAEQRPPAKLLLWITDVPPGGEHKRSEHKRLRHIKDHFKVSLQVEIKVNREAFHLESPLDELLL